MTATLTRRRRTKPAAVSAREEAITELRHKIEMYRATVHHLATGRPVPADDAGRMASILDFLLLPDWTFTRDVRACRRYLAMQEEAKQASGAQAEAIIDRAAELAFNHPHLLMPIELAIAMRLRAREQMHARQVGHLLGLPQPGSKCP